MERRAYRLSPLSAFHFGRQGMEIESSGETFPSDSLFSALVATSMELDRNAPAFWANWQGGQQPPFIFSSVFPYIGDIPLFPMPRLQIKLPDNLGKDVRKTLKKLRYVSGTILSRILSNETIAWGKSGQPLALQNNLIWIDESDRAQLPLALQKSAPEHLKEVKVWFIGGVPRVTLDRVTNASNVFQVGRTHFSAGCGLWFMADIHSDSDYLEMCLEDLGVRGIGGERSVGYGQFEVKHDLPLPTFSEPKQVSRLLTLSRYLPDGTELEAGVLQGQASYDLVKIGGWLASPSSAAQRRKTLYMIEAGSVLNPIGTSFLGQIAEVQPDYPSETGKVRHPVYRNGFALTIGVGG